MLSDDKKGGSFGKALNFEGGYLTGNDSTHLELYGQNFTIEAWVKLDVITGTQVIVQKWDEATNACSYRLKIVEGIPQLDLTSALGRCTAHPFSDSGA